MMDVLDSINQKGLSLIEVIIAIALSTMVITGMLSAVLYSLSSAQDSQLQNEATQYSQQGMELLRTLSGSAVSSGTYCLNDGNPPTLQAQSSCTTTPNLNSRFIRQVTINKNNVECSNVLTKITVTTSWRDGDCPSTDLYCKKSTLSSCVSNL